MSRQYSNRSFVPSDNSSRRFHQQPIQNNFSYFQYPSHRQTVESNREINNLPLHRITTTATVSASTPHYHFENPSAASFTRYPPWFDDDWEDHNRSISRTSHHNNHTKRQRLSAINTSNSQTYHHHERKRSRNDENEREQPYRAHHYQPYPNHRPTQIQATNPTPRHVPSFSRSFDYGSHNHHELPSSPPPVTSSYHQPIPSFNTHQQRTRMTFEPTSNHSPLFHRTSMTTHIHQQPSPSFLLTDLLHRVIDAHAASYNDYHPSTTSIDLIAYGWISPSHEIFSLPTAFSIQFSDFFDLIIPDETPVIGLTDSELERIPTMIYTNIKTDDDKCTVCLNEYINGEKLKYLKCKHYFHSECIDPWLKTSIRCPICRSEQIN